MTVIKVGTRPSKLAIKQVEEISALLPSVQFKVFKIETKGDKDKKIPLSEVDGTDFFTSEIEQALLNRWIDAAIHSAKDLNANLTDERLAVVAVTSGLSVLECLVSRGGIKLDQLPLGAVVGTSSAKRKEAITRFRPDLIVKEIRGDIDERLKQLDDGKFDTLIMAHAALIRLGYQHRIAQVIPREIIEPHPLQGKLSVQILRDRHDLIQLFKELTNAN